MQVVKIVLCSLILMAASFIYAMEGGAPPPNPPNDFDKLSDDVMQNVIMTDSTLSVRDLLMLARVDSRSRLNTFHAPVRLEDFTGVNTDVNSLMGILSTFQLVISLNLEPFHDILTDNVLERVVLQCPHLRRLSLRRCNHLSPTGFAHLAGLTDLNSLDLGGWDVPPILIQQGELERSCSSITDDGLSGLPISITELRLAGCNRITSTGFAHLGRLPLKSLILDCASIVNTDLVNLPVSLTSLSCVYCRYLCQQHPVNFARFVNMKTLNLALTDTKNEDIETLPVSLTDLTLGGCHELTAPGFAHLAKLIALRRLDVGGTSMSDVSLRILPPSLTSLYLSQCEQVTDEGLRFLPAGLVDLGLRSCTQLTRTGFTNLGRLGGLRILYLNNNATDSILAILPTSLWELQIHNCHEVTGAGLATALTRQQNLTSLNILGCTKVKSDNLVAIVRSCPSLTVLIWQESISEELRAQLLAIRPALKITTYR